MSKENQKKEEMQLQKALNKSETEISKLDLMDDYFLEKLNMDIQQLKLLQTWYPGLTAPELMYAIGYQNETGLSIAKKEVWLVKRGSYQTINGKKEWIEKYEPMTGIEGSRKIARENSKKIGIPYIPANTGVLMKDIPTVTQDEKGELIYGSSNELVGFAEVEINGSISRTEVPFKEACQMTKGKKDNSGNYIEYPRLTAFWEKNPLGMLQKTAEARLNRKVYGVSVEVEGDLLNDIESAEIITESSIVKNDQIKQIEGIKKEFETAEEIEPDTEVEKDESGLPFPDSDIDKAKFHNEDMTNEEKFFILCEENQITGDDLLKYFNEVKEIPVINSTDIFTNEDFKEFRDAVVSNGTELKAINNFKKNK